VWFYISVADAYSVDVRNRSEHLLCIELHEDVWKALPSLNILSIQRVYGFWDVLHHHMQIYLISVLSLREIRVLQLKNIRMIQFFEDLQLSVLVSLILQYLLNGNDLSSFSNFSLVYHSKGPTTDHLFSLLRLLGRIDLHLLFNRFFFRDRLLLLPTLLDHNALILVLIACQNISACS